MDYINWEDDEVMKAMLALMTAIEKQDVRADLTITADIHVARSEPRFIGTFFGTTRINERKV